MPTAGSAVLATWYDLSGTDAADFLSWLHDTHLPALLRRPGHLWAAHYRTLTDAQLSDADGDADILSHTRQMSVSGNAAPDLGRGSQYLMMVGADTAAVFMDPLHSDLDGKMEDRTQQMLGLRRGVRTMVLQDLVRQPGPDTVGSATSLPAPRIQMGTLQTSPGADVDLWRWYLTERLPLMATLPGAVQTRLMAGAVGWAKLAVIYEFADAEAHALFRVRGEQDTIARFSTGGTFFPNGRVQQAPFGPTVADRIWPPA